LSEIRATTISDAAGTGPIALTKQSAAKAWAFIDQLNGNTVDNSFNVTSFSDIGTGNGTVNLTNAMVSSTQVSQLTSYRSGTIDISGNAGRSMSNSLSVRAITKTYSGAFGDTEYGMTLHGDLA
jgi:hypothetical protein